MSLFGRRERREIAELTEYVDRLRAQRDKAVKAEVTAAFNRSQVLAQNADLDEKYIGVAIVNNRLTEELTRSRWQRVIARKAARRILAAYTTEKARADRLQQRLDQALGLETAAIALGAGWQDRRQKHMYLDKPAAEEAS